MKKIIVDRPIEDIKHFLKDKYPYNFKDKGNNVIVYQDKWISFGLNFNYLSEGIEIKTKWDFPPFMALVFIISLITGLVTALLFAGIYEIFARRFRRKILNELKEWTEQKPKFKRFPIFPKQHYSYRRGYRY